MNTDERFLRAALAEGGMPITAGFVPPDGKPVPVDQTTAPIPIWGAVGKLPRWAQVAFAARSARCVLELRHPVRHLDHARPHKHTETVRVVEEAALQGKVNADTADRTLLAAEAVRREGILYHAAYAAHEASHPAGRRSELTRHVIEVAMETVRCLTHWRSESRTAPPTSLPAQDLCLLLKLSAEQKWTDDTPVPPTVFGTMWNDTFPWSSEGGPVPNELDELDKID